VNLLRKIALAYRRRTHHLIRYADGYQELLARRSSKLILMSEFIHDWFSELDVVYLGVAPGITPTAVGALKNDL